MKFLDANIFLYAALDQGATGDRARALLLAVGPASPAATSALVLDEVLWALRKRFGKAPALREGRRLAGLPGLHLLPIAAAEWIRALDLMDAKEGLKPNDALHAACALEAGLSIIVSTDPDFDGVPGLKRLGIA